MHPAVFCVKVGNMESIYDVVSSLPYLSDGARRNNNFLVYGPSCHGFGFDKFTRFLLFLLRWRHHYANRGGVAGCLSFLEYGQRFAFSQSGSATLADYLTLSRSTSPGGKIV